jgi:hypothetical protein
MPEKRLLITQPWQIKSYLTFAGTALSAETAESNLVKEG